MIPEAGQPRSGIWGVVPASRALALVVGGGVWARWASLISSGVGGTRANQSWLKTRSRFLSSRKMPTLPRLGSPGLPVDADHGQGREPVLVAVVVDGVEVGAERQGVAEEQRSQGVVGGGPALGGLGDEGQPGLCRPGVFVPAVFVEAAGHGRYGFPA